MRVNGAADSDFFFEGVNAQKRQFKHGDRAIFISVIARTKLCHLKRPDRNTIKVVGVLAKTTIAHVHGKLAAGLFGHQFGNFFNMFCERTAFAPDGHVPFRRRRFGDKRKTQGADSCATQVFGH